MEIRQHKPFKRIIPIHFFVYYDFQWSVNNQFIVCKMRSISIIAMLLITKTQIVIKQMVSFHLKRNQSKYYIFYNINSTTINYYLILILSDYFSSSHEIHVSGYISAGAQHLSRRVFIPEYNWYYLSLSTYSNHFKSDQQEEKMKKPCFIYRIFFLLAQNKREQNKSERWKLLTFHSRWRAEKKKKNKTPHKHSLAQLSFLIIFNKLSSIFITALIRGYFV